jgi:hypothetical protein
MAHKFMRIARLNPITHMRQSMETWLQTGYPHPTSTEDNINDNKDENEDTSHCNMALTNIFTHTDYNHIFPLLLRKLTMRLPAAS